MLPSSLHYHQGFGHLDHANMVGQDHTPAPHAQMTGLDALAHSSQYALQEMQDTDTLRAQHTPVQNHQFSRTKDESPPLNAGSEGSGTQRNDKTSGGPVRRRISRACDQCNQLRTKCDGQSPCAHCVEFGLACEYNRERKKRGKASRRDIAQQNASATATTTAPSDQSQPSPASATESTHAYQAVPEMPPAPQSSLKRRRSSEYPARNTMPPAPSMAQNEPVTTQNVANFRNHDRQEHLQPAVESHNRIAPFPPPSLPSIVNAHRGSTGMNDYGGVTQDFSRAPLQQPGTNGHNILRGDQATLQHPMSTNNTMPSMPYGSPFNVPSPQSQSGLNAYRVPESPGSMPGYMGASSNAGSPAWLQPSPSAALYTHLAHVPTNQTLRYPVLRPILSRISAIIPVSLACDLLEIYFSSSYSAFIQPSSPYILGIIFRKRSFLRQENPRTCSPALLASMLWVAAQTSDAQFLTSPPSSRGKVCQQLMELTISLLRPLIHTPAEGLNNQGTNTVVNGVALGGFGVALHTARHDNDHGTPGAAGAIDDVATYINLATVVSASEYKAASLRWWNAAWSLARELKLGRELPPSPETPEEDVAPEGNADVEIGMSAHHSINNRLRRSSNIHGANVRRPGAVTDEEREERRRLWWLLYIVDRHLALCYNRPLFLLDAECDGLLQPEDDIVYQAGDYYPAENRPEHYFRRRGPSFECTGHSIYGYFLPLMTILGEIVDLNHTRNHPRFGARFRTSSDLDDMTHEISLQLDAYGRSLEAFSARFIPSSKPSDNTDNLQSTSPAAPTGARITEPVLLTKIIVAYGTHLMHTMHILLNGKWDPISLLDDNDLWISSPSFISATGHAVNAAEAISGILDYDPDLSFMPFFFGIYLLQGSFLLLLIADKLQGEASASVVKACESIVRAHEVCVVTLNTEYQRNFRKVMRSALQQVRGRTIEDFGEQQQRRREVLVLYRWTGDGSGLAL